jgi:hypothetical protein
MKKRTDCLLDGKLIQKAQPLKTIRVWPGGAGCCLTELSMTHAWQLPEQGVCFK